MTQHPCDWCGDTHTPSDARTWIDEWWAGKSAWHYCTAACMLEHATALNTASRELRRKATR